MLNCSFVNSDTWNVTAKISFVSHDGFFVKVALLKDVLCLWKAEVEKKPPEMSVDDAYEALELARGQHHEDATVRKAYYKLAQLYHPDKNPHGEVRDRSQLHPRQRQFAFINL